MQLQPKLTLKVSQRQVLTPGLVQMVSVLALNKLELKEMINTEMVENPVLEELELAGVSLEERAGMEGNLERSAEQVAAENERAEKDPKDPFEEIDFGSYFQEYLDPGYRTTSSFEEYDKPSFENFLSQPGTLSDHLLWQLGSLTLTPAVETAAELVIGNLDENGYLTATDEELIDLLTAETNGATHEELAAAVAEALGIVNNLDPVGVGARDLRQCLLLQIDAQEAEAKIVLRRKAVSQNGNGNGSSACKQVDTVAASVFATARSIVASHLTLLQKKDIRELTHRCGRTAGEVQAAIDFIRTLDPRPGQRYNQAETRLIEPDVAFVKRDDHYVVVVNDEDMPTLRLNQGYRRMLEQKQTDRNVREYVKERYRSAIQLLRNIEQRKNTIVRTCEVILRRQEEFLERGVEALKPMMIKEVAEEIGVHPSTVSRAVANKYVHTPQGVYELRFFFSEGVNGPEGGDLPLVLLKRKVKKLIEEEDHRRPLTDDRLAAELRRQGIQVTRRTVAKYREDMQIPSTHQRRVR